MAAKPRKSAFGPGDVARLQFVSDPMVHPSGNRLAYVLRSADKQTAENRYRAEIRLVELDSGHERVLSGSEMDSEAPLWSPSGDRLLLLSRRLTQLKGGVRLAEWSPDGRNIAFLGAVDPRDEGGESGPAPFSKDVQVLNSAHWRLNALGSWAHRRFHLHLVRASGGRAKQLTHGEWSVGGPFLTPSCFCFSRDGRLLYYLATPAPEDDWAAVRRLDVFELDLETGQPRRLTKFPGMLLAVRLSPTGDLLAIGNELKLGTASANRLWRVRARTGRIELVELGVDLSLGDAINSDVRFTSRDYDPWISPEGDRARVRITERGSVRLAEVDLKRGGLGWLSPDNSSTLAWHGAPDGSTWAEVRSAVTQLPELWVSRQGAPAKRVTGHNDRLLASRRAFPARPLQFRASDGARVEGWGLIPPEIGRAHV